MSVIPAPVRSLLDLFTTELEDVRFGDVDTKSLAGVVAEVETAAEAVSSAQALLDAARATLQERQDALMQHAQRALAYARVYAESNAILSARLDEIVLSRALRRARPDTDALILSSDPEPARRPRGRPRKAPSSELAAVTASATAE